MVLDDHGGAFFTDHDLQKQRVNRAKQQWAGCIYRGSVRVAAAQRGHYGRIHNPQPLHAKDTQALVNHGGWI